MRHRNRTVLVAVTALVLLTGCSVSYPYQLLLTVRNADDGTPVEGAAVVLDASTMADERQADLEAGYHAVGVTDKGGQFTPEVNVNHWPQESTRWYVKVRKDGFEPLVVTVRPPEPRGKDVSPLPVAVDLKPLRK